MIGKTLQILGVLAVLGLVGGSIAGFAILEDRVKVVVQSDDAEQGPDATALLRDDLQVVARDVQALQQAIVENFGQLATGLEQGAEARHGDVRTLQQDVTRLAKQQERMQQSLAVLEARLASVATAEQVQALHAAGAAMPVVPTPTPATVVEPTTPDAVAAEPETTPAKTEPVEPAPAPKKPGFLSFSLPSSGFSFDAPQDYALLPQLCRVGFDAKSTLHDFTGVTSAVQGRFRADFDDPAGLCEGFVACEVATLKTGVDGRDENMLEHLDSGNHAQIRFDVQRFRAAPDGVDVAKRRASGEVVGKMTIRGQTREFTMPATIEVDAQQRLVITGQQKLKLTDYGVPVPNQLGLISMEDEVVVWIALRARAQAPSGPAAQDGGR